MAFKYRFGSFAVLGLGQFGFSIVQTLSEYDVNVLACDRDEARVHAAMDLATHTVQADISDENTLYGLGLGNFDVVIIAMGDEFEASQIATMMAKEQGADWVVVKARNERQKKILLNIGADEVILPESEMAVKTARKLVLPNIRDILEESQYYTISEMKPLEDWVGKTLRQADIRRKHDLTVLGVRRGNKLSLPVSPDRVLEADDILITLSEHKH